MHSRSSFEEERNKKNRQSLTYQLQCPESRGLLREGRHSLPARVAQPAGVHLAHVAHADDANTLFAVHGCLSGCTLQGVCEETSVFSPW